MWAARRAPKYTKSRAPFHVDVSTPPAPLELFLRTNM